jgi:hypothetical protein
VFCSIHLFEVFSTSGKSTHLLVPLVPLCAIGKPSTHLPVPLWVPLVPLWVPLFPLCAIGKPSTHLPVPLWVLPVPLCDIEKPSIHLPVPLLVLPPVTLWNRTLIEPVTLWNRTRIERILEPRRIRHSALPMLSRLEWALPDPCSYDNARFQATFLHVSNE